MNAHIITYYELFTEIYTDATELQLSPVAHIADFYLERWWVLWAAAHASVNVQRTERV